MENVFDPKRVRDVLSSPDYPPFPMGDVYERITAKTGIDFTASTKFLRMLPVFLEGDAHADARRRMALLLAPRRRDMEAAVQQEAGRLIDTLFTRQREVELVSELSTPLWHAAMSHIASDEERLLAMSISMLFDANASPTRRWATNQKLSAFLESASDERVMSLGLAALGFRPFIGSIALSIHETVAHFPATALSRMPWPDQLPVSAVHFIERLNGTVSPEPQVDDQNLIRCNLHHSLFEGHSNVASTYGHGPHLCLGKGVTEAAWKATAARLRMTHFAAEARELEMNPSEKPFHEPLRACIFIGEASQ